MNNLMECIKEIPSKLNEIYINKENTFKTIKTYLQNEKSISKINFICSGSSYNAGLTSKAFIENECGIKVELTYPNIFLNYTNLIEKDTLYIFISQGGVTKLVYESIKKAKKNNCITIAITSSNLSPIAKEADIAIDIGCGDEPFLYRTIGYSTTVGTIYLLGLEIALHNKRINLEDIKKYYEDYIHCYENLENIQDATIRWYKENKFEILRRNEFLLTGTNDFFGIAQEADIKFMEMIPLFTRSFELEEFIHGPQNAFNNSMIYFILSKKGEDEEKIKALAKFLKEQIGICFIVGASTLEDIDLYLEMKSKYFQTLEIITAFQTMAYHIAIDRGRDLSKGINININNYIKKSL